MIGKLRSRWQWPVSLLLVLLGLGLLLFDQFGARVRGQMPDPAGPQCCPNCQQAYADATSSCPTSSNTFCMQLAASGYQMCMWWCNPNCPPAVAYCNGVPYYYPQTSCCGGILYPTGPGFGCCSGQLYNTNVAACVNGTTVSSLSNWIWSSTPCSSQ